MEVGCVQQGDCAHIPQRYAPERNALIDRIGRCAIDENARTATLVWEFPGTFSVDDWYRTEWYQPFWGDADRLENGNVLITAGERGADTESRIFEVTKQDGQVVWELHLGPDIGVYRAERITPPLVRAINP